MAKKKSLLGGIDILLLLGLLAGATLMAYPFVSDAWVTYQNERVLRRVRQRETQTQRRAQARAFQRLVRLNRQLDASNTQPGLATYTQALANDKMTAKRQEKKLAAKTIAELTIPKIKADLPVYANTSDWLLQFGACRLDGSNYPVGGAGNRAVISAHRGVPNATLFTHLPRLKRGDDFYLTVDGHHLAYQVIQKRVIKPTDVAALRRVPHRDLVTLMTCTPYMINSHRLLVTGKRVPYTAAAARQTQADQWWNRLKLWFWALMAALFAWGFWRVMRMLIVSRRNYLLRLTVAPAMTVLVRTGRLGHKRYFDADASGNLIVQLPGARYHIVAGKRHFKAYVRRIKDQKLTVR